MPVVDFEIEHTYQTDPTNGIVVDVVLQATRPTRVLAHIDTGAANCLFRSEYAELIGLNLTDGVPMRFSPAGGGSIDAYGHTVNLTVLGHSVESLVYFTDRPQFTRNVLGRLGWLHHFKFGLVEYESKLYLSRY